MVPLSPGFRCLFLPGVLWSRHWAGQGQVMEARRSWARGSCLIHPGVPRAQHDARTLRMVWCYKRKSFRSQWPELRPLPSKTLKPFQRASHIQEQFCEVISLCLILSHCPGHGPSYYSYWAQLSSDGHSFYFPGLEEGIVVTDLLSGLFLQPQ